MRTWPIGWAAGAERAFSPVEVGFFSQGVLVVILLRHWRTISTLCVDDIQAVGLNDIRAFQART